MTCGCTPPTPPQYNNSPTSKDPGDMMLGENMDCYAKRSINDDSLKDDAREEPKNKIKNTFLNATLNGAALEVNETFTLTDGPRTATSWELVSTPALTNITTISAVGKVAGQITQAEEGKTFKVLISARDATGVIDSREFTLAPNRAKKGDSLTFVIPYVPSSGAARVNSPFGMRFHPIKQTNKMHAGQDWVAADAAAKGKGTIVAVADGIVARVNMSSGGYGTHVMINHNSADNKLLCVTLYGHLSSATVSVGQKVVQGQTVGREGSTGASTGNHLHFEARLNGTTPVDPTPYYNGAVAVVVNPGAPPITGGQGLTTKEVAARSKDDCPKVIDEGGPSMNSPTPPTALDNKSPYTSSCIPDVRPTFAEVKAAIDKALNEDGDLSVEDKNFIHVVAKIESRYDPYAKNPTSSATGLYQMLNNIANAYYGQMGLKADCPNRCDAYLATKAMILFYKKELRRYWLNYVASGKTKIANLSIASTTHSARFSSLTQAEFMYGLVHHDGIGNAVNGVDKGGIKYFKEKAGAA